MHGSRSATWRRACSTSSSVVSLSRSSARSTDSSPTGWRAKQPDAARPPQGQRRGRAPPALGRT
eukprot:6425748-Prymnesium_polylepis.1